MAPWRSETGFTLTELLVGLAVLGLALASVVTFHDRGLWAYLTGSNRVEVQQNARVALARLAREVRAAQDVSVQVSPPQLTIRTDWNGNGIPGENLAVQVAPDEPLRGERVVYRLNGDVLERQESGVDAAFVPVAGGVVRLEFTTPTAKTLSITLQTRSEENLPTGSGADTRSQLATTVRLRNS
jgi:prepilin-type N-terminal cleavage/methylation domain-containing protein